MKSLTTITTVTCLLGSPLVLAQAPAQQPPAGQQASAPPSGPREVTVAAIAGVIAAGAQWKQVWQEMGNNGDGIVAAPDGSLLIAQNDLSQVVKLDPNDKPSVYLTNTQTGGSLSIDSKGRLLTVQRLEPMGTISYLAPERKVLADTFQGKPLGTLGRLNDLVADKKDGAYFTVGPGVYYASPSGQVTSLTDDIRPNGIILSPDEKTLYVTNRTVVVAFDIQPDGLVKNRRDFSMLEGGANGDGMTIDATGRVYVSSGPGVHVLSPDGKYLGLIPTPRNIISVAFAGRDKKTLYVVARGARDAEGKEVANAAIIYKIPMLAQGFQGRAK